MGSNRTLTLFAAILLTACGGGSGGNSSGGDVQPPAVKAGVFLADKDVDGQLELY